MKMTAFWDIAPCSLIEVDRHFRGAYCLHHQGDDIRDYTTQYPRRLFIVLMMEAVRTYEASVNLHEPTRRNIPEGCHLIALMIEAVRTYETSVNLQEPTWRNIPEGCHLHNL
jgi:hypothetical protein